MSTDLQPEPIAEEIENTENTENNSRKKVRKRLPPDIAYKKLFKTLEDCKNNPPKHSVASLKEFGKEATEDKEAKGFVPFKCTCQAPIGDMKAGEEFYIQARSTETALSYAVSHFLTVEGTGTGVRGRRKIDPVYLKFICMMHEKKDRIPAFQADIDAFFEDEKTKHYANLDFTQPYEKLVAEHCK